MYYFEEGKNSYTVKIDDRLRLIDQKLRLSRNLLKQKAYSNALTVIKKGIDLCENGLFDEDKPLVLKSHLSNLKNESLCHLKLADWAAMERVCGDYVDLKLGRKKKGKGGLKEGKVGDGAQAINLIDVGKLKKKKEEKEKEEGKEKKEKQKEISKNLKIEGKMYYRLIHSLKKQCKYKEGLQKIEKINDFLALDDPYRKDIGKQKSELKRLMKEYLEKDKKMFKGAFKF